MNTTTFAQSAHGVTPARAPRPAAARRLRLRRAGVVLWRGLEAHGRARALRDLALLQHHWEFHEPQFTGHLADARAFLVDEGSRRGHRQVNAK